MNKLALVALAVSVASLVLVAAKSFAQEEKPEPRIWTDSTTLCQYVITSEGGIERRMVDNGVIYIHMGCKPNPAVVQKK